MVPRRARGAEEIAGCLHAMWRGGGKGEGDAVSRNLCKTNCDWCGCDEVDLTGPEHPITPNEAGRYFSQFERLIVADAECVVCGAKYLAWVDSEPRGFFDLSYRSSFSDEPEEADMGFASPKEIRGYMRRLRELVALERWRCE